MKVLVVDDEPPARQRLRQLLDDMDNYDVIGEAANGHEALTRCADLQPDIVLLDIRMPGLDGIETARHLNALAQPPAVVFTTAYDEYAVDAFDARAIGYVLKPVRRRKLVTALDHAAKLAANTLVDVASQPNVGGARKHVCARAHGELRLIPIEDVISFRADQKYTAVEHDGGQDLIDDSLKALADEFDSEFVRIHRSALIAVNRIERVAKTEDGKSRVVIRNYSQPEDNELIISRRHVADVRRRLTGA